jgi:hypothetical protein
MDLSPWLILRQASDAAAQDRPDEAHRLIVPLIDEGYRKAWRVAREVVKSYCRRATRSLDRDNGARAAWRDLLAAEALNTGEKCVAELRVTLTKLGLVKARAALEAGSPVVAVETLARLRDHGVRHPDMKKVEEAAQDWVLAAEKADRGDFLLALADLDRLRSRLPCPPMGLDRFRVEVEARHERFRGAVSRAHEAAEARKWRLSLAAAGDALAAAPEHREIRTLRTKAWQAAYPETAEYMAPQGNNAEPVSVPRTRETPPVAALPRAAPVSAGSRLMGRQTPPDPPRRSDRGDRTPIHTPDVTAGFSGRGSAPGDGSSERSPLPRRFLLWVDGIAGYLVCTGSRVTFGQAVLEGGPVDVPLFADVSRVHADITRDGEGYLVEAGKAAPVNGKDVARSVQVNGRDASRSVLTPGDRVTLGSTCQFLFQKPVTVSSSARLELTSGHRLMLPVEGVLLMANELILGPGPQAHVNVPDLPGKVLLYRSKEGLGIRYAEGPFTINDRPCPDRMTLTLPASFECGSLTFTVEAVGPRV